MARFGVADTYLLTGGQTILPGFDPQKGDLIEIDMAAYDLSAVDDLGHRREYGDWVLFNRRTGQVVTRIPAGTDGSFDLAAVALLDARGERHRVADAQRRGTVVRYDLAKAA